MLIVTRSLIVELFFCHLLCLSCAFSFYQVDQNYEYIMVKITSLSKMVWV